MEPLLILVSDLIFASKIRATAAAAGITIKQVRDPAKIADEPGVKLIVDLNLPGAISAAAAWGIAAGKPVIGFVSHVDTPTIEAARAAGLQTILPRSRFVQILPQLVQDTDPGVK